MAHPSASRFQKPSRRAVELLRAGESAHVEYKREVRAVTAKVLASLANAVALDPAVDEATLLVGVDEAEEAATGVTRGVVFGLERGVERAVARVQDIARVVGPIPAEVRVIEEGVATLTPFLRVEIRPTMPPHHDEEGRRQTRQGRSTRALTDDELLGIYLERETGSFATRYRRAATDLEAAVGALGSRVDDIGVAIDHRIAGPLQLLAATADEAVEAAKGARVAASDAEDAAYAAGAAAEEVSDSVRRLEMETVDLGSALNRLNNDSVSSLPERLHHVRRVVWWEFSVDTWTRESSRAEKLASSLRELLSRPIPLDPAFNAWERQIWDEVLQLRRRERDGRGTLKWWTNVQSTVESMIEFPYYVAPDLPDIRAELARDYDFAVDDPDSQTRTFQRLLD